MKLTEYHPLGIYWNVLKIDRFMLVSFILYYLSDKTLMQLMIFMGIQVLSAAYLIVCKPMESALVISWVPNLTMLLKTLTRKPHTAPGSFSKNPVMAL